jgi:hypothetical protein
VDLITTVELAVAITNGAVALGTIILALIAYKTLREGREQLKVLSDQAAILRSQQDPWPRIHSFSFKRNQLLASLENRGAGRARKLGVESWFYPTIFQPTDDKGRPTKLTEQILEDYKKKDQKVTGRFLEKAGTQLTEGEFKSGRPSSVVSFLVSQLKGDSLLEPGITLDFRLQTEEPLFKIDFGKDRFVVVKFADLRKILRENGFQFASLWFRIICKDSVDRPVDGESVRFIVDLGGHGTLEEAMQEGHQPSLHAVDAHEVEKEVGWLDAGIYRAERSIENLPPELRAKFEKKSKSRFWRIYRRQP